MTSVSPKACFIESSRKPSVDCVESASTASSSQSSAPASPRTPSTSMRQAVVEHKVFTPSEARVDELLAVQQKLFTYRVLGNLLKGPHLYTLINHHPITICGGMFKRELLDALYAEILVMPFFEGPLAAMSEYTTGDADEPAIAARDIKHRLNAVAISTRALNTALAENRSVVFYPYGKDEALRANTDDGRQTLTAGKKTAARAAIISGKPIVPVAEMFPGGLDVPHGIDNNLYLRSMYKASGLITQYFGLPGFVPAILATTRDKQGVSLATRALQIVGKGLLDWIRQGGGKLPLDARVIKLDHQPSFHLVGKPIPLSAEDKADLEHLINEGFSQKSMQLGNKKIPREQKTHYQSFIRRVDLFDKRVRKQQDALLIIAHLIQPIYTEHGQNDSQIKRLEQWAAALQEIDPDLLCKLRDELHQVPKQLRPKNPLGHIQEVLFNKFNQGAGLNAAELQEIIENFLPNTIFPALDLSSFSYGF